MSGSPSTHRAMRLLQEEAELEEIVRLVGVDALSDRDQLVLEAARSIGKTTCTRTPSMKLTPTPPDQTIQMLRLVMAFYDVGQRLLKEGVSLVRVGIFPSGRDWRAKYLPEGRLGEIDRLYNGLMAYAGRPWAEVGKMLKNTVPYVNWSDH